jgi:CHAT domain
MEYREFRMVITGEKNVIAKRSRYDKINGMSTLPDITDKQIHMDRLWSQTISMFRFWLEKNKSDQRDDFVVLGWNLYNALFGDDEIRQAFEKELNESLKKKSNPPLRLILEFKPGARELAEYPWEFLYCPIGKGYFLGACTEMILARHTPWPMYPDETTRDERRPSSEPLRILMVISSPEFEEVNSYFDSSKMRNKLPEISAEDVRRKISSLKYATVETLSKPTKESLTDRINTFKPHVLHFIGHGKNGKLALVQAKDKALADWIEDASLADCFADHQPRLIFLHACEGAVSGSYELFKGLALKLMEARIPTVVAMQFEVGIGEASRFATRFYEALSLGRSIDEAVQLGRAELGTGKNEQGQQNYSSRAFGCPVVYIQNCSEEIVLVQAQEQDTDGDQSQAQQPPTKNAGMSACPVCGIQLSSKAKFCRNKECIAGELVPCDECGELMEKNSRCVNCGFMGAPTNRGSVTAIRVPTSNNQRPPAAAVGGSRSGI